MAQIAYRAILAAANDPTNLHSRTEDGAQAYKIKTVMVLFTDTGVIGTHRAIMDAPPKGFNFSLRGRR
jgi:hypothetical protein